MVRDLGCFRLLSDTVIKKMTSGVSIFDKSEEITHDLREIAALLEARESACWGQAATLSTVGVACFACRIHSCVDVVLLRVEGEICTLSPHKERGFFWGIWMKVIPDAVITLFKTLN